MALRPKECSGTKGIPADLPMLFVRTAPSFGAGIYPSGDRGATRGGNLQSHGHFGSESFGDVTSFAHAAQVLRGKKVVLRKGVSTADSDRSFCGGRTLNPRRNESERRNRLWKRQMGGLRSLF